MIDDLIFLGCVVLLLVLLFAGPLLANGLEHWTVLIGVLQAF
jgi:hypothetical protein